MQSIQATAPTRASWLEDEFWLERAVRLARRHGAATVHVLDGRLLRETWGSRAALVAPADLTDVTAYLATRAPGTTLQLRRTAERAGARVVSTTI
ncbi:MAG: hypothetical protein KF729_22205 [Sandaracinaceae bacterium]|nr:hypothetical protein [Sandaracinaceae bacterium]